MTLGERILTIRLKAGLSQREFAKEMKCSQAVISDYEKDKKSPSYTKLLLIQELAKKYKVKIKLL